MWHRRPLKKAKNGVHLNLGGHHRLKRRCQEGVLPGRLRIYSLLGKTVADPLATTAGNFLRSIPPVLIASLPFLSALRWDLLGIFYAVLSGALASGVGYAVWYVAVRYLAAFQAATVQLSVPILASLAGIVFLGESLSVRMVLASVAVLGGVALVLGGKQHG